MTSTDAYSEWDAAYVLGALDPGQRREFEEHLATCASCQEAVAELAGMPGLLAQVPPGEVLAMDHPGIEGMADPPGTLTPVASLEPAGGRRVESRRRPWLVAAAAAAAALVVGGLVGYAASTASHGSTPVATTTVTAPPTGVPGRLAFSPVEPASMTAVLDIVPQGSQTVLRVECQYAVGTEQPGEPGYQGAWADYSIWVVPKSGTPVEIKTWTARPDKVMHPSGVSPVPLNQIQSVEIRRVDSGHTVLRADVA
jgi:hypothetical protein